MRHYLATSSAIKVLTPKEQDNVLCCNLSHLAKTDAPQVDIDTNFLSGGSHITDCLIEIKQTTGTGYKPDSILR